jgi:hypothetical protein
VTAWDIVRLVIAVPVALLAVLVALCNCYYLVRVVIRGVASSPSPMPLIGTILAVVLALLLPLESGALRLGIAGVVNLATDGAWALGGAAEYFWGRLGRDRRAP